MVEDSYGGINKEGIGVVFFIEEIGNLIVYQRKLSI